MIIDLDAHQGNGHELDKLEVRDRDLFIVDMFNSQIYPGDMGALSAIDVSVPLRSGTGDVEYLRRLEESLAEAFTSLVCLILHLKV